MVNRQLTSILLVSCFLLFACSTTKPPQTEPDTKVPEQTKLPQPPSPIELPEEELLPPNPPTQESISAITIPDEKPDQNNNYPFLGDKQAKTSIVYYGDFANLIDSQIAFIHLSSVKRDYVRSGKVHLIFKPVSSENKNSELAALASLCMWEQGSKQFWRYFDVLSTFHAQLGQASLLNYADRVPNVNKIQFQNCLTSRKYSDLVKNSDLNAKRAQIMKTPTMVIGDEVIILTPAVAYKDLQGIINKEINRNVLS